MTTPSEEYIQYICFLYNDYYDDRIEDSRPPVARDRRCIPGEDWKPGQSAVHKSLSVFQHELEERGIHLSTSKIKKMLAATKAGDIGTILEIMEFAHNTLNPLQLYSNEAELASIIRWVYMKAMDTYRIEREDKAGVGYVDFIFDPYEKNDDAIILELKVDHTPEEAIQQIKDRQYELRFEGKFGERSEYTGRILAVGIAYDREDSNKRHQCKIEVLREKLR